jgi:hypothetical protein
MQQKIRIGSRVQNVVDDQTGKVTSIGLGGYTVVVLLDTGATAEYPVADLKVIKAK